MKRFSILFLTITTLILTACGSKNTTATDNPTDTTAVTTVQFNADTAYASIVRQCAFGERVPGTEAHRRCGDYIVQSFKDLGLTVKEQCANLKAYDGTTYPARNIIASYLPENKDRIVIAAHWDSRPWADADADTLNHRKPVPAANDGASGVAVMLELARCLRELSPTFGIDFVCFDTEDCGAPYWDEANAPADGSDWCLGSQYWAAHTESDYRPRFGILLDMVGGSDARFCYEGVSMRYARDVMVQIWDAATRADASTLFPAIEGGYAQDDHVPMNELAGIPTVDIIPYVEGAHSFGATWHTLADTPDNISKQTLRGVGQTLLQFLSEQQ